MIISTYCHISQLFASLANRSSVFEKITKTGQSIHESVPVVTLHNIYYGIVILEHVLLSNYTTVVMDIYAMLTSDPRYQLLAVYSAQHLRAVAGRVIARAELPPLNFSTLLWRSMWQSPIPPLYTLNQVTNFYRKTAAHIHDLMALSRGSRPIIKVFSISSLLIRLFIWLVLLKKTGVLAGKCQYGENTQRTGSMAMHIILFRCLCMMGFRMLIQLNTMLRSTTIF